MFLIIALLFDLVYRSLLHDSICTQTKNNPFVIQLLKTIPGFPDFFS